MPTPNPHIVALLERYREQKAASTALELELADIKASLDAALGLTEACAVDGLGEVRRIPPSQSTAWSTPRLEMIIAALRLMGEDKTADQIEEARQIRPRESYLMIKLSPVTTVPTV